MTGREYAEFDLSHLQPLLELVAVFFLVALLAMGSVAFVLTFLVWWDGTSCARRAAARRAERRAARDKSEWKARG